MRINKLRIVPILIAVITVIYVIPAHANYLWHLCGHSRICWPHRKAVYYKKSFSVCFGAELELTKVYKQISIINEKEGDVWQ